ncbi:MAG: hypothetical protein QGI05_01310 [Candidatus Omnitrophota bacterium]|jgi:hypothetical protein|nr:hypothetical protein [Candidatus Omnitrophota bacterium]
MDRTLRTILWVLVLLVLLSSFSAGWFFIAKERLHDEYVNLEILFKTNIDRMKREIVSINKERRDLWEKLDAVKKELNKFEAKNEKLEADKEEALKKKDDLGQELAMVKKAKFFLEKKLKEMESDEFLANLLTEKIALEVASKTWKGLLAAKDLEIKKLQEANIDLTKGFSEFEQEKNVMAQELKNSTEVARILSKDLLREKTRHEDERKILGKLATENNLLKNSTIELEKVRDKFDRLLAEKDRIELRVSGLEEDLEIKDTELNNLRIVFAKARGTTELRAEAYHSPEEVDLPPIVLERHGYSDPDSYNSSLDRITEDRALSGQVVTVNKEHNFVVIDLGGVDGVDVGMNFNVYRDNLNIATLEVIQARDGISACDIKDARGGYFIEVADDIVKR